MAEIRNLADLEKLVGIRTVEKCFIEYMLSTMTKANRLEDLENHRATMDEDEMMSFIYQQDWSSLVFRALETHSVNGSYTCNSYKSKKILFDYWGDIDADEVSTNAFENPEAFLVEVMILNSIYLLNSSELDLDSEEFEDMDEFLNYLKEARL